MAVESRVEAGSAVEWLLASDEPAIAALARRDLLDEDVRPSLAELRHGALVGGLLAGQRRDGGFGPERRRIGRRSCSSSTACPARCAPASRSTRPGSWPTIRRSGTTTSPRRCWASRGPATCATTVRRRPSPMLTLNALRILRTAGRLEPA